MQKIAAEESARLIRDGVVKVVVSKYGNHALRVKFAGKPSEDMLAALKEWGFRWDSRGKEWEFRAAPQASPLFSPKEEWEEALRTSQEELERVKEKLLQYLPKPIVLIEGFDEIYLVE